MNNRMEPTPLQPHKVAVVVGASRGLGAALARQLAAEGYQVALLARDEKRLQTLCDELNAAGPGRARWYVHDVTDYDQAPRLLQRILADFGRMDVFIYNAGVLATAGANAYDFAVDRRVLEVNLMGALAWLNPVADFFQQVGYGHIIGISSVAGDRGRVGNPAYNTSKAALNTYLEALRNRLTRRGVHVMTVKPGFMDTDMLAGVSRVFWVISPEKAAQAVLRAMKRRRQVIYVPARWRWVMLLIQHIPSFIFRRLDI
jgi:short-subunit dehydrogenase